jgi:phosphatidylglycerophosphate synthase
MPSKFRLRYIFRPLVKLISRALIKIGFTPNLATVLMILLAFLSFISISIFSNLLLFSILVFTTGIMDGCDGTIARLTDTASASGGFLDSVMDRISEFLIFLGLLIFCWDNILWRIFDLKLIIIISFLASVMISYFRAKAEAFYEGDYDIGLMGRSERLFYIFATSLVAFFYGFLNEFLFIFMWLVIISASFRFVKIKKQIKEKEGKLRAISV